MPEHVAADAVADAIATLRRIAVLVERSRGPRHRSGSFRRAAAALAEVSPPEVLEWATAGTLTDLHAVGPVTASVVAEVIASGRSQYLDDLERQFPAGAGDALRRALRGDCHVHSDWSDGRVPIEVMAGAARDAGLDYIVLTDHSPRLTIAHGLSPERLREQLAAIDGLNHQLAPFRILTGIEVDILPDGSLDQEDALLARLDVVVGSVHSLLRMEPMPMTDRLLRAIEHPHLDILGHCTGQMTRSRGDRPPSTFDARAVFEAARQHHKAIEVNAQPARRDPPDELLDLAIELGCYVSIDSDAHTPSEFDWLLLGCDRVAARDVPAERIVNCWTSDELLAWTAAHSGGGPDTGTSTTGSAP